MSGLKISGLFLVGIAIVKLSVIAAIKLRGAKQ